MSFLRMLAPATVAVAVVALAPLATPDSGSTEIATPSSPTTVSAGASATATNSRAPIFAVFPVNPTAGIKFGWQIKLSYPTATLGCAVKSFTKNSVGSLNSYTASCTPKLASAGSGVVSITYSRGFSTWIARKNLSWLSLSLGARTSWSALSRQPSKSPFAGYAAPTAPGAAVRWNPCVAGIPVRVNFGSVLRANPARIAQEEVLIKQAIANVKIRSLLPLVYVGTTNFMPRQGATVDPINPNGITIAFANFGTGPG